MRIFLVREGTYTLDARRDFYHIYSLFSLNRMDFYDQLLLNLLSTTNL